MRLPLTVALTLSIACGHSPKPQAPLPTPNDSASASAIAFLECLARSGAECVAPHKAGDAWAALGDLEQVETIPWPLLPPRMFQAADRIGSRQSRGRQ